MQEINRSIYIILVACLLLAVVIAMMLIEPKFFDKEDPEQYTYLGNNWHQIDLGAFELSSPTDFKYVRQKGIDSYVGLITNGIDTLHFDFGWYSNDLSDRKFSRSHDTVNGIPAITAFSKPTGAGIHFPTAKGENALTIFSSTINKGLASQIFKTIKIEGSTGRTTYELGSNVFPVLSAREQLFNKNCIHCHSLDYKLVGPSLRSIVGRTSKEWFTSWIRSPDQLIESNEQAAELYRDYGKISHPYFSLTDEEIELLISFTEEQKGRY